MLDVSVGVVMAVFFVAAAVNHGLSATLLRPTYEAELRAGRNRIRWAEFAVSAPILMLLIALYTGVTDVAALVVVGVATLVMIVCGWMQEAAQPARSADHDDGAVLGRGRGRDRPVVDRRRSDDRGLRDPGVRRCRSSCPCSSSGRASGSTSGSSTARSGRGRTTSTASRPSWCSAWSPRPRWPGRSWPGSTLL